MKPFRWNAEKNEVLKRSRGVSFESIVVAVEADGLLDIVEHPNKAKYPNQRVLVVSFDGYVYLTPFVEEVDCFFLKTVLPSRQATRDYLRQGELNAKRMVSTSKKCCLPSKKAVSSLSQRKLNWRSSELLQGLPQ